MDIKIEGGTAPGSENLCLSCIYSQVVRGQKLDEELITCSRLTVYGDTYARVPFRVSSCNQYKRAGLPSIHDMEKIAWVLVTKSDAKQIGFVRAKDMTGAERKKAGLTEFDYD
jgi:hypothetical protein